MWYVSEWFLAHQNISKKYGAFQSGWDSSKDHGHKYGSKYIETFRNNIMHMFKDGIDDERKKKILEECCQSSEQSILVDLIFLQKVK